MSDTLEWYRENYAVRTLLSGLKLARSEYSYYQPGCIADDLDLNIDRTILPKEEQDYRWNCSSLIGRAEKLLRKTYTWL
jgi:hypothetical protein